MKILTLTALVVLANCFWIHGEPTNSANGSGTNSSVSSGQVGQTNSSGDLNTNAVIVTNGVPMGIIQIKNMEGNGIAGVDIRLGYSSSHYAPTYKTDKDGRARINAIFSGLTAGGPSIWFDVHGTTNWPFIITLPTRLRRFDEKKTNSSGSRVNPPTKQLILVRNKDGNGIRNVKVMAGQNTLSGREISRTDASGKAEIAGGYDQLIIDAGEIEIYFKPRDVEWPCEFTLPTSWTEPPF